MPHLRQQIYFRSDGFSFWKLNLDARTRLANRLHPFHVKGTAEVLMSGRKRSLKITWRQAWPIWLIFGLLFGVGALGVWVLTPGTQSRVRLLAQGEDVNLASSELQNGDPQLFAVPLSSGRTTEVFIERGAADKVTVAFARCRKCYRAGYYRQGGQIFCGRCNAPMERLAYGRLPASGNDCTQIPIQFERSSENVIIRASAVRDAFAQWYTPALSKDTPKDGPQ